ncbi:hypothetical protein MB02_11825 [Croceicoccus estronivorus]|uniref:TonB-dependent receptor n=1 Tax=Croceicoccus estronivorus TaxID=1172626 RepID=UPI00083528DE|nr:TonB-dependent receptor [Croceicoccus estronivorus]OCC23317.1 hypothetical protein MB02_11825 [Croceicoccus estronivorus]
MVKGILLSGAGIAVLAVVSGLSATSAIASEAATSPFDSQSDGAEPEEGVARGVESEDIPGLIVVTARKRAESLQDAPIAIAALDASALENNNLSSLTDAASLAGGGVVIANTGITTTLSIRGVSSDSTNTGFDQTVGIVIDGVFYDRSRWANLGFMDMAQIEILKGPQALYFGRSAVAGAINITTAGPSDKFEAGATVGYEFAGKEFYGEGFLSGPLTETLGARLAFRLSDSKGAYKNTSFSNPSKHFGGAEEQAARLTLDWDVTSRFNATVKLQYARRRDDGIGVYSQLFNCKGPGVANPYVVTGMPGMIGLEPYPVQDDCKLNRTVNVDLAAPGTDIGGPYSELEAVSASLKLAYEGDGVTVTSISAYSDYDYGYATGLIASGGLITAADDESNKALYQELRVASDFDGPFNFLVGANYQHSRFRYANLNQLLLPPPDPADGRNISQDHFSKQKGDGWSAFGEVTFNMAQGLELAAGARYSKERKDSRYTLTYVNPGQTFFFLPEGTVLEDKFRDDRWSPQVTLSYKPNNNLMIYGAYRTGFLPGGFSHGGTPSAGLSPADFTFDSETAKGFEAGIRSTLAGGKVQANLTAYSYRYSNLQVSIYQPATASFITGNVGNSITKGIEAELDWYPTTGLSFRGFANYNIGETRKTRGQCYNAQTAADGCQLSDFTQDLSGRPLPRAPRWTFSLGTNYEQPIGNDVTFQVGATLNYSGRYYVEPTLNPELVQDDFFRLDANVGVETGPWKVALIGRNLTNQAIASFGAIRGFTNDALFTLQPFREVQLQLSYRY